MLDRSVNDNTVGKQVEINKGVVGIEGNDNPHGILRVVHRCIPSDSLANVSGKRPVQIDRRFSVQLRYVCECFL